MKKLNKTVAAAAFSWIVVAISEMIPGFALEGRADRAQFFMVVWLCGCELFKNHDQ